MDLGANHILNVSVGALPLVYFISLPVIQFWGSYKGNAGMEHWSSWQLPEQEQRDYHGSNIALSLFGMVGAWPIHCAFSSKLQ